MSAQCNTCYVASTEPAWIAQIVVRNRIDQPCELHREHFDDLINLDGKVTGYTYPVRCAECG